MAKRRSRIVARARTGQAAIESIEAQTQRMPPPPLYDLTELQRHANRLFGFSAQKTLDIAQALYERHKLISYPRTDSRHLSQDVARTLPRVVEAIAGPYREHARAGHRRASAGPPLRGRRQGHRSPRHHSHRHLADQASLSPDERKIYDLICRRLLSAWHDDHIWTVTTVITAIRNDAIVDRYHTSGSAVQQVGWKVLDLAPREGEESRRRRRRRRRAEQELPPGLAKGQPQDVLDVEVLKKKTRAAQALHRRHAAHRDGDRGQDARREGTLRRHEGDAAWARRPRAPPSSKCCSSASTSCATARAWKPPTRASA